MSRSKGILEFFITADSAAYRAEIKKIAQQTDQLDKKFQALGDAVIKPFLASSAAIGASLKVFASFEAGLVKVGKTANLSGSELQSFGNNILNLSKTLPVSTTRLLELSASAAQLGIKGEQNILRFAATLAKLESATNIVGEEGASAIARLLTVTGDGVKTIERFGSVIVALGNNSAATESEILDVATRVGQATAAFGIGSTKVLGISAALKSLGFEAELAGSAINVAFAQMQKAISSGGEALRVLMDITGLTREELTKTFAEDATKVFSLFVENLNKLPAKDVAAAMDALGLSGLRVNQVIQTLAKNSDVLTNSLKLATAEAEKQTALDKEFSAATQTLNAHFQLAYNALQRLAKTIGSDLSPAATKALALFTKIADGLVVLDQKSGGALSSILAYTAGITGATYAIAKIGKVVVSTTFFVRGFTAAIAAGTIGLGTWVAGISTAIAVGSKLGQVVGKIGGEMILENNAVERATKLRADLTKLLEKQAKLEEKASGGSEKAAEKLKAIDLEVLKTQQLIRVIEEGEKRRIAAIQERDKAEKGIADNKTKPEQAQAGATPAAQAQTPEGGDLSGISAREKQKTAIQQQEIENRITNAQREGEILKMMANKESEESIKLATERNAILSGIEENKTAQAKLSQELSVGGLEEAEQAKLAKQLEFAKVEEENLAQKLVNLETFEIEARQRKAEAEALVREEGIALRDGHAAEDLAFLESQLLTQQEVERKYSQERLKRKSEEHNKFLELEKKYGKSYAILDKFFNSERVVELSKTTQRLEQLTTNSNSKLKAIGKAAAIVNIGIDTARGVMGAIASFAGLGPVGAVLGAIASAAIVASGAQQIQKVNGANSGALVGGGITGKDTEPFMLSKGELVVPAPLAPQVAETFQNIENAKLNGGNSGVNIAISFENNQFLGSVDRAFTTNLAKEIGNQINENILAPFPTRSLVA